MRHSLIRAHVFKFFMHFSAKNDVILKFSALPVLLMILLFIQGIDCSLLYSSFMYDIVSFTFDANTIQTFDGSLITITTVCTITSSHGE